MAFVPGLSGDRFHFDQDGDGPARYNIIHFKQVSPGKYRWIRVGEYVEGELRLNFSGRYLFTSLNYQSILNYEFMSLYQLILKLILSYPIQLILHIVLGQTWLHNLTYL